MAVVVSLFNFAPSSSKSVDEFRVELAGSSFI